MRNLSSLLKGESKLIDRRRRTRFGKKNHSLYCVGFGDSPGVIWGIMEARSQRYSYVNRPRL